VAVIETNGRGVEIDGVLNEISDFVMGVDIVPDPFNINI
jgi:hypothetical protein